MDKLQNALEFAKDQSLTTGLYGQISVAVVVASTSTMGVRIPTVVTALMVVANTTSGITPKVEELTTTVTGFSIH